MAIRTDRETYLPNPATVTPGAAGWSFIDGLSGLKITRLTDERDGGGFGTSYAIWPTANRDATKLWVFSSASNSYWIMEFDPVSGSRVGALKSVSPAPAKLFANYESFLWSGLDADKGFMVVDAKVYSYRPSTNAYTLIKDLAPALGTETFYTQQHKSVDDKRIAAAGRFGFMVYDMELDRLLLDVRTMDMNGIALDRTGKWLLYVPSDDNVEFVYNVETGTREELRSDRSTGLPDFTIGHCDVGSDLIVGNDRWRGALSARKFSAPHTTTVPFVYAPYWISHHVSMTADDQNYALLSTYGDIVGPDPNRFKDECLQVGVSATEAGKVKRLFHHRVNLSDPDWSKRYWATPRANTSRDGRFVFFTSNMGGTRNDLYVADLSGTVTQPNPTPTPAPTPTPTPVPTPPAPTPSPTVPRAAITSPSVGAKLSGVATITATAEDEAGIKDVYLIVDGVTSGVTNTMPYSFKFDTKRLPDGEHSIFVRAWNATGKAGDSQAVKVEVVNAVPAPTPAPTPTPVPVPTPQPCSMTVTPAELVLLEGSTGTITVNLQNMTAPTEVRAVSSSGQVMVSPGIKQVAGTSASVPFQVAVKKRGGTVTFSSGCGSKVVVVNVR